MLDMRSIPALLVALLFGTSFSAVRAAGVEIVVRLPAGMNPKSATAVVRDLKLESVGAIHSGSVIFNKLLADTPYDIAITLSDGTILQGIDLGWLNEEPASQDAGELTDDDKNEIH